MAAQALAISSGAFSALYVSRIRECNQRNRPLLITPISRQNQSGVMTISQSPDGVDLSVKNCCRVLGYNAMPPAISRFSRQAAQDLADLRSEIRRPRARSQLHRSSTRSRKASFAAILAISLARVERCVRCGSSLEALWSRFRAFWARITASSRCDL